MNSQDIKLLVRSVTHNNGSFNFQVLWSFLIFPRKEKLAHKVLSETRDS